MHTLRSIAVLGIVALGTSVAYGQEGSTPSTQTRGNGWESCAALDLDPLDAYEALANYETVFGKAAISWTDKDYLQVQELANACNGAVLPDGNVVDALRWHETMKRALKNIFEVAYIHQEIMRRAESLNAIEIELPLCGALATYVVPIKDLHDNSADIFGLPLYGMQQNDLRAAIEHMNNCMAFLPQHGFAVFGTPAATSQKAVYAMMDRALMVQAWNEEWKHWTEKRTTDIVVEFESFRIPPTFLSDEAKSMVRRYNRAAGKNNGFTIDAVYNLVSLTEGILEEPLSDIDHAYATAIKNAVSKYIFSQSDDSAGSPRLP